MILSEHGRQNYYDEKKSEFVSNPLFIRTCHNETVCVNLVHYYKHTFYNECYSPKIVYIIIFSLGLSLLLAQTSENMTPCPCLRAEPRDCRVVHYSSPRWASLDPRERLE